MFILIILSLSYTYMPYVSLNYVLCWCFVVMYINCIVVYGKTSCKTASGWWVILVKYVLIKIKNKRIKSISNELDITFHVILSQLSGHCGVIRNWLRRYQQNVSWASKTWGRCVKIAVFIDICRFVMSCKKYNSVCSLMMHCLTKNARYKHQITLSWPHQQFATRLHTLFYMYTMTTYNHRINHKWLTHNQPKITCPW